MVELLERKKPRQQRAIATVDSVLEAATHILHERGLAGLNTNVVARRAGVSIGSLYQYFPGKDAIVAALILRSHEAIVAGIRRILAETAGVTAQEAIGAMLHMLIDDQPISPHVNRVLEAEELRLPKTAAVLAAEREIEDLNIAFFARFLDPALSAEKVRIAAADTICIVRSLMDNAAEQKTSRTSDLAERLQRAVEGYLGPLLRDRWEFRSIEKSDTSS